jgi:predicted dithiol-disulfide oxidoreductase (DUF899 family)
MSSESATKLESQIGQKIEALLQLQSEIKALKQQWSAAAAAPVAEDYQFGSDAGPVRLSELFGDHDDLVIVHNMGQGCTYCTLWADGLVGLHPHLESRAAFALSSPDEPATQRAFADGRAWPYRMISVAENQFAQDMGFADSEGNYHPGYSTFRRQADGSIHRVSKDYFGPGDSYCGVWHIFDNLFEGAGDWHPQYTYDQ